MSILMMTTTTTTKLLAAAIAAACVLAVGCSANRSILESSKATPTPWAARPADGPPINEATADRDVEEMRTAEFRYIYIIRRKDGGVFDSGDKNVIKQQTAEANRRVGSENGRAVVIGSNYPVTAEKMMSLYERFAVENYSPVTPPANAADNTNSNSTNGAGNSADNSNAAVKK